MTDVHKVALCREIIQSLRLHLVHRQLILSWDSRYINIRRGAYLLAALGLASNPWQYLSNAATFLTVLSGFSIFLAPFTGVMLADYLVVRRCVIKLEDCYVGNNSSIYWYWHGFHWRALLAWVLGVFPTMPGLIMTVRDPEAYNSWVRTFHIAFFVGLSVSFAAFWLICVISKPPGVGIGLTYHKENLDSAEMVPDHSSMTSGDEKIEAEVKVVKTDV